MCSLRLVPKENHRVLESYQDFILSRQAALLSPRTIEFYERTVGEFISFLSERGIDEPEGITSALVRGYFSCVSERGVASITVHAHARGTRAFLRFLKEEGYIPPTPITIKMPRVEQKKTRVLSADELAVEIEQKLPWVEKVVTKWVISGTSARNLTPKVAQAKIGSTAKASLKNLESKEIFALPSPIRFEVDFKSPRYAYLIADIPGIERESGVSVRFTGSGMIEISGIWRLMLNACMSQLPV